MSSAMAIDFDFFSSIGNIFCNIYTVYDMQGDLSPLLLTMDTVY